MCLETFATFCENFMSLFYWKFNRLVSAGVYPWPWSIRKLYDYTFKIRTKSNSPAANARNENQKAEKVTTFLSNTLTRSSIPKTRFLCGEPHVSVQVILYSGCIHISLTIGFVWTEQSETERKGRDRISRWEGGFTICFTYSRLN